MSDAIRIDNKIIDEKRKEWGLPKPTEFAEGRITPGLIEQLLPLLHLPFDDSAIEQSNTSGFNTKGVNYNLQLNRLQEVMGYTRVRVEHTCTDYEKVVNEKVDEGKKKTTTMHYYKVSVRLMIGDYVPYVDSNGVPNSRFISCYECVGVGFAGANTKGTAEKNALANGLKDCFKNMGMLRYLYLNESNDGGNNQKERKTQVKLLEDAQVLKNGLVAVRGKVKDLKENKVVDMVVFRENKYNMEEHKKLVNLLVKFEHQLSKDKVLNVGYRVNNHNGKEQYIINSLYKEAN